jgi:hypothetical protein
MNYGIIHTHTHTHTHTYIYIFAMLKNYENYVHKRMITLGSDSLLIVCIVMSIINLRI